MKLPTIFLSITILASTFATAADEKPATKTATTSGTVESMFKKLDVNVNGSLSIEEFKRSRMGRNDPAKAEETFKLKDKDANGQMTLDELKGSPQAKKPVVDGAQGVPASVDVKKPASTVTPEDKKATP